MESAVDSWLQEAIATLLQVVEDKILANCSRLNGQAREDCEAKVRKEGKKDADRLRMMHALAHLVILLGLDHKSCCGGSNSPQGESKSDPARAAADQKLAAELKVVLKVAMDNYVLCVARARSPEDEKKCQDAAVAHITNGFNISYKTWCKNVHMVTEAPSTLGAASPSSTLPGVGPLNVPIAMRADSKASLIEVVTRVVGHMKTQRSDER